jgi:hypothetical protein
MTLFTQHGYKDKALFALNVCRMHLHATTLSDITTANGLFVTTDAWMGNDNKKHSSPYTWPQSHRPPNFIWQLWQEAIRTSALVPHQQELQICYAIGKWNDQLIRWNWLSNQDKSILYHRKMNLWQSFRPNFI